MRDIPFMVSRITVPLKMYNNRGTAINYEHCAHATVYHKTILDADCQEILRQGDTFHVRIGGAVVELWRQKRVAAGNMNAPVGLQAGFSMTHRKAKDPPFN